MNNYKKKRNRAVIILAALTAAVLGFVWVFSLVVTITEDSLGQMQNKVDSLSETITSLDFDEGFVRDSFIDERMKDVIVFSELLEPALSEEPGENIRTYDHGFVFYQDEEGSFFFPDGFSKEKTDLLTGILRQVFEQEKFLSEGTDFFEVEDKSVSEALEYASYVFVSRTGDSFGYCELVSDTDYDVFRASHSNRDEVLGAAEKAYDARMIVVRSRTDDIVISPDTLFYCSEDIREALENEEGTMDITAFREQMREKLPHYTFMTNRISDDLMLVIGYHISNIDVSVSREIAISAILILMLGITMIVWVTSVYQFVLKHDLNEEQRVRYNPVRVRIIVVSYVALGTIAVFLFTMFSKAVNNLQLQAEASDNVLDALEYRLVAMDMEAEYEDRTESEETAEYGRRIVELMNLYPETIARENLVRCREIIGADNITLFDDQGDEMMSASDMIHLSLGTGDEPTAPFRRLLKGVPYLALTDIPFFDSGKQELHNAVGLCVRLENGKYGALIIDMPPDSQSAGNAEDQNEIMRALTPEGSLIFAAEEESNIIRYSSDEELPGNNILALGITEKNKRDNAADFYRLRQQRYYGTSMRMNGMLYYYMQKEAAIYNGVALFSLADSIGTLLILGLLGAYLLFGYTKEVYEENSRLGEKASLRVLENYTLDSSRRRDRARGREKINPAEYWKNGSPEQKTMIVFGTMLAAGCLNVFLRIVSPGSSRGGGSVFNFLMRGNWTRGLNLFSFCSVLILGFSIAAGMILLSIFARLLQNVLDARGETICRLMMNLLRYLSVLVFLYYALAYLGVDTRTLLVGAGIVGFAITFGARDLITDLLSGLLIVFEGDFRVGDIVDIGGFKGTVMEIGVRATKLLGSGGNIKTISNHDVRNTINMTRMDSWYELEVRIPADISLADTEEMLRKELPDIGRRIPEIKSGPEYKGVVAIGGSQITLCINAECDEEDYFTVQNKMNKEIFLLFTRHGITIT